MTRTPRTAAAAPPKPDDRPTTQEDMLDEALDETFPASDPISPGAGVSPDPTVPRADDQGKPSRAPKDGPAR